MIAVADRLQAGVAKALLGKAALPDDLPWVTGSLGLLGTKPSWDLMKGCDTFLMVGSAFPYSEFLPKPGDARGVQIDIDGDDAQPALSDGSQHGRRQRGHACARCCRCSNRRPRIDWRTRHREGRRRMVEDAGRAARWTPADPINPQRVFWELSKRLPENCIMTGDSGSVANWYARDIKMRRGMKGSLSGGLASLGAATPYAMAAKMAFPDRVVIAFIGDGAMQMNGLNVMITISKYWKQWSNPRLIVMVLNNRDLNQVTWEERVQLGDGKTEVDAEHPGFPLSQIRRAAGAEGHLRRRSGKDRRRLGRGAGGRPAGDPRMLHRPERAAAAAAHHAEGRQELHDDDGRRAGTRQRAEEQRQAIVVVGAAGGGRLV